jgi:hypothetical protein
MSAAAYKTQTPQVSAQFINSNFVRKLDDGRTKEAEAEGTAFIRQKLRQESFAREIIEPVMLTDDEIDRDENTDQPKKIVEKEPDSIATFVPFTGTASRTWFRGRRFAVYFGKTESQRFTKSKFELMTYQNDIRKILSDNSVKDMADQEDQKFIDTVNAILALAPTQITNPGTFTSSAFKVGFQAMVNRKQPIGKILMSKALYYEALDLPATSVGNDVASRHYDLGIEAEEKLWGIPVISTIKQDIVDGAVAGSNTRRSAYVFSPQNYLGCFFLLQDATLFIKQEADIIEFWSYAAPGIGLGNTFAMQRIDFLP